MKTRNLIKLAAVASCLISGAAFAVNDIANTAHDLSATGTNDNSQICVYCHTPHNGNAAISAPLWNRAATATSFTIYDTSVSSTIDNNTGQPEGVSLACLGCHDGSIALDSIANPPTEAGIYALSNAGAGTFMSGSALLGADLSNDHPVSIGYNTTTGDTTMVDPSTITTLPLFAGSQDATYQVECGTCHDVHKNTINPFLRISNASSALCQTCHQK